MDFELENSFDSGCLDEFESERRICLFSCYDL